MSQSNNIRTPEKCRLCLNSSYTFVSMFQMNETARHMTNADIAMFSASILILKDDGFPKILCNSCLQSMNKSYQFRQQCERSQEILHANTQVDKEIDWREVRGILNDAEKFLATINDKDNPLYKDLGEIEAKIDALSPIPDDLFNERTKNTYELVDETYIRPHIEQNHCENPEKTIGELMDEENEWESDELVPLQPSDSDRDIRESNVDKPISKIHETEIHEDFDCDYNYDMMKKDLDEIFYGADITETEMRKRVISRARKPRTSHDLAKKTRPSTLPRPNKHKSASALCAVCVPSAQKLLKCKICDEEYQHLRDHLKQKHPKLTCRICGGLFRNYSTISKHIKNVHSINEERVHKCEMCNYKTHYRSAYQFHVKRHNNERNFKCDFGNCGRAFVSNSLLVFHKKEKHGTDIKFTCDTCGKGFTTLGSFNKHIRNSHVTEADRNIPCDICNKLFMSPRRLSFHKRLHRGRQHACKFCDKKFTRKDYLNEHTRLHTGERPHACKLCDQKFSQRQMLRYHLKNHHGMHNPRTR